MIIEEINMQAMFGAGCFWGVEKSFRRLAITDATVGYSGGRTLNPTYEQVCSKRTGHVEVVLIEFDENLISYKSLLEKFFNCHNPTHNHSQATDINDQYKSVIFTYDDEQENIAQDYKDQLDASARFERPIGTLIAPAEKFWRAEDYHQQYFDKK
ncbi:MAG: peptide-methionine (S)-S-oxide reductase MsrA [Rhizobiales bacterium]|nr:peptide-methionine (S)-S-oxide reductase MsrA [Hyphomicrobiales bacterium]